MPRAGAQRAAAARSTRLACYSYSITMLVVIDPNGGTPLYAQIAAQLRRAIADGKVRAGERLPAARELAESLAVNLHTVLRAYDELRAEGVLDVRRGRGVVVVGAAGDRARLVDLARTLVAEGARQGLQLKDLRKLLGEVS
jgi:DNA-binding transcriptional regulator YhcF (GntR family)